MIVLMSWLSEMLERELPPAAEVAQLLTSQGLEVEQIFDLNDRAAAFEIANVSSVEEGDSGNWLTVDRTTGSCAVFCTDRSVTAGEQILYAPAGTETQAGLIGERQFGERTSRGMAASWFEAGLGGEAGRVARPSSGELTKRAADDTLLEIGLTPNRGDCLSHLGVARELAAALGIALPRLGDTTLPIASPAFAENITLTLDDPGCDRYALLHFAHLTPDAQQLALIRRRIGLCGQRSIAPVVDLTNYLLLETGQPTHAFDADKIQSIRVRRAQHKEQAKLLDGKTYELTDSDLIIDCDGKTGALAGVMGAEADSVGNTTTRFALESAHFDPVTVRRTRTRLGISTEASYRFERGVDPTMALEGARRFAWLVANWFGAHIEGLQLAGAKDSAAQNVFLPRAEMRQRLGRSVNDDRISVLLQNYGFVVEERSDGWDVLVPSWRHDVTIAADLIEEIARGIGYDELGEELPFLAEHLADKVSDHYDQLTDLMVQHGFFETVNHDFYAPADDEWQDGGQAVALTNPLGRDLSLMRRSLLPGLLRAAGYNLARQEGCCFLFESGDVYWQQQGEPEQEFCCSAIIAGHPESRYWYHERGTAAPWIQLKQLAVAALNLQGTPASQKLINQLLAGHESTALLWEHENRTVAHMCQLPAAIGKKYQINAPVWVLEIWPDRLPYRAPAPLRMQPLRELPATERDLAFLVPSGIPVGQVVAWIEELRPTWLERFWMFDYYTGKGIPEGTSSQGFRFQFRDPQRSLTAQEVDEQLRLLLTGLQQRADIKLREGSVL